MIMSKKDVRVFWILACIGLGFVLLKNPKCNRGCQTLAEHLISHGVDELL